MTRISIISASAIALFSCLSTPAIAQASAQTCTSIIEDASRLVCFDTAFDTGPAETNVPAEVQTKWKKSIDSSALTDEKSVYLTVASNENISGRFGSGSSPASLMLRCKENTTSAIFSFNGHHMADLQSYGVIEYRIDKQPNGKLRTNESTDNSALGLWNGGVAIPFAKRLIGHDDLVIRVTPYGESPITVTFPISGLESEITELRETCGW